MKQLIRLAATVTSESLYHHNKAFASFIAIVFSVVVIAAQAALPVVTFDGDAITVSVPDGAVTGTNHLTLCWGASDAGGVVADWDHSSVLSEDVTATGGTWTVSASEKGIAAESVMRAFVRDQFSYYRIVEYVESTTGTAGSGTSSKTLAVETGVRAKTGLHVKAKLRWLKTGGDYSFCGARNRSGDSTRMYPIYVYNNKWLLGYGSRNPNTASCVKDTDYEVETKL